MMHEKNSKKIALLLIATKFGTQEFQSSNHSHAKFQPIFGNGLWTKRRFEFCVFMGDESGPCETQLFDAKQDLWRFYQGESDPKTIPMIGESYLDHQLYDMAKGLR